MTDRIRHKFSPEINQHKVGQQQSKKSIPLTSVQILE